MGAVNFSIDLRLAKIFRSDLGADCFVETGTFQGDTAAAMQDLFDQVITIELSEDLFKRATERFSSSLNVETFLGNSADILTVLNSRLAQRSVLYWLDAHWCEADLTSGKQSQCPLLDEIKAIGKLDDHSALLIDDARFFLAPPTYPHEVSQWPRLDRIIQALHALNASHRLMIVNDVIAFYPAVVEAQMVNYARDFGIDWLRASQSLAENIELRKDNEDKEAVIQDLQANSNDLINDFERLISRVYLGRNLKAVDLEILQKEEFIQHQARLIRASIDILSSDFASNQELLDSSARPDISKRQLQFALNALQHELEQKEELIQRQAVIIDKSHRGLGRAVAFRGRQIARVFRPRLGNLHQHGPVSLTLPTSYYNTPTLPQFPRISIVTPSFNQGHYIKQTIDSVLDQNYPELEYFVQDGASTDDTVDVIQSYGSAITGWESSKDTGQSNAINKAFAHTSGDIMAWLNSDDILLPGALHYVARYFADNPDVDVIYGHRLIIDENGAMTGRWMLPPHDDAVLSWVDYVPQETMFWRRSIWDKAGGSIDESFRFAMDWDLILRFRASGAKFVRLPRMLGGFRVHALQKTSAVISDIGHQEMDRLRERELGRVPSYLEIRKAVLPYLARHIASDLSWRLQRRIKPQKKSV